MVRLLLNAADFVFIRLSNKLAQGIVRVLGRYLVRQLEAVNVVARFLKAAARLLSTWLASWS